MTDEQIIDEIAEMLKRPGDRESEQDRYRGWLIVETCTWKERGAVADGEPLFGGMEYSERLLVYDDAKGADLISKAHTGDVDADSVLCNVAAKFITVGAPLPPRLGSYIEDLLLQRSGEPRFNEGGNRYQNFTRNFTIAHAIEHLRRNHSIKNNTRAIELVRKALEKIGVHISADGIRQALKRMPKGKHS